MKNIDPFEWVLICLFVALIAIGIVVASDRHQEKTAMRFDSERHME